MISESTCDGIGEWQSLDAWTRAWYDTSIVARYIDSPYHPDEEMLDRLRGYFHCGLSPIEAAQACFGPKH